MAGVQHCFKGNGIIFLIVLFAVHDADAQDHCLDENHSTPPFLEKRNSLYDMDSSPVCDRYIVEGWYGATGYFMTTSPPSLTKCGTLYPVWLNGGIRCHGGVSIPCRPCAPYNDQDQPPSEGHTRIASACQIGFKDNCERSYNIEVKNCGDFLVYKLKPVDACNSAYCFERIKNATTTITYITSPGAISTSYAATGATSPDVTLSTDITREIIASTSSSTTEPNTDVTLPPSTSTSNTSKNVTLPPSTSTTDTSKDVTIPPSITTNETIKYATSTRERSNTQTAGSQVSSSVQCQGANHINVFNDHSGDIKLKMSSALDGDNMTCFQLLLQDEQTPFLLVIISVTEAFGIRAVPYDITFTGNGLSCDRHSIERMLQVSYRVVGQPTQFCSLLLDVETSGLSVCKYHCACPNPVSCREVTIYLASGKNREPWSLCEMFASNR